MKLCTFLSLMSVCLLFITCSKKPKGSPGTNEIWLEYKLFTPAQLVVKVGTTVTFTNKDNANHSVTNANGVFDSGKISSGDSYTFTFPNTGSFSYSCNYHSSVSAEQGVIVVQ
jgi:plastocyanin